MSETTEVVGAVKEEIFSRLDLLAEKLGTTAEHVYPIMVKQQAIDEITSIVASTLSIALFLIMLTFFLKAFKDYHAETKQEEYNAIKCIISGGVGVLAVISTAVNTSTAVTCIGKLINPEYYAIQEIIHFIK